MDTQEIYQHLKGKRFIKTFEYRYRDGRREPCGRPVIGEIVAVNLDEKNMEVESYDYDQRESATIKYQLPCYDDFTSAELGNLCFDYVFKHNGRDLIIRFWEI